MTIRVFTDRIEFDNYTLRIDDSGLRVTTPTSPAVTGTFAAAGFSSFSPMYGLVSGYSSGGTTPDTTTIDKFPFASDANATDVGDLTQVTGFAAGQQD